jgi:effector-binding domain-containing protein
MNTLKNDTNVIEIEKNEVLTKEGYLNLVSEFKESTKDKKHKPYWGKSWDGDKIKIKGNFTFEIFIFYSLLRNKDPKKTTHDIKSEKYLMALHSLKIGRYFNDIKQVMPSINEDIFKLVVSKI